MPTLSTCHVCRATFGSRSLAQLHVTVIHPSVSNAALFESVQTASPPKGHTRYRIYQNMVELLSKEAYRLRLRGSEEQLCADSYNLLAKLDKGISSPSGIARLLALGQGLRGELIDLPSKLGIRDRRKVIQALHHDDATIAELLRDLVSSEGGRQVVMNLTNDCDGSECILNLIERVLYDTGIYWPIMCGLSMNEKPTPQEYARGEVFKRKLQRINVRLSEASLQLPQSVHISGVTLLEREPVACGAFADIYLGEYRGNRVAIKRLRPSSSVDHEHLGSRARRLYREISLCKGLEHPNVIAFFGVDREVFDGNAICIVTSWAQHSGVVQYVESRKVSGDEICRLLYETARGLSYLHRQNVVHGDLHGRNILVDHNSRVRLADFGMANFADATTASGSAGRPGLARWPKPETIEPEAYGLLSVRLTRQTDIFDFAGVCWEIHDGRSPFSKMTPMQAVMEIRGGRRPAREDAKRSIRSAIWHIMEDCWREHPSSRPDTKHVLKSLEAVIPRSMTASRERPKHKSASLPLFSFSNEESLGKTPVSNGRPFRTAAESVPPLPRIQPKTTEYHAPILAGKTSTSQLASLVNRLTKSNHRQASLPPEQALRERNARLERSVAQQRKQGTH